MPSDPNPSSRGGASTSEGPRSSVPLIAATSARTEPLAARFRPLFVVGRGGMGSVEVALETGKDGGAEIVALKRMLPKAVLDKRQTEMFLREAKLASLLVHPNVVRASSFGEVDGELFLVMEYIEGEPLSSVVQKAHAREGTLSLPFVLHVLAEICEGLHAAHELKDDTGRPLNVVHRDVSPHNLMVAYEGQIKLLDFGVAKIEAIDADGRTKTGEVKGKTAYMSPEQAMGDEIDRRSDLYSVGAVLFEAISGRKMWGGGTDLEVIRRLALEEPPPLKDAAPETPAAICDLQRRLVARDPNKRPATALEVARELREAIATLGTRPDTKLVRSLMTRLFADEIERRHATLRAAMAEAASGARLSRPGLGEPATDATPVPATTRANISSAGQRRARGLLLVMSGVALAAIAGGVLWRSAGTSRSNGHGVVSTSAVVHGEESPVAPPVVSATASPASSSTPAATVSPEQANEKSPRTSPMQSPPQSHLFMKPGTKPAPPRSSSVPKPTAPLDVDPTPF